VNATHTSTHSTNKGGKDLKKVNHHKERKKKSQSAKEKKTKSKTNKVFKSKHLRCSPRPKKGGGGGNGGLEKKWISSIVYINYANYQRRMAWPHFFCLDAKPSASHSSKKKMRPSHAPFHGWLCCCLGELNRSIQITKPQHPEPLLINPKTLNPKPKTSAARRAEDPKRFRV